MEEIPMTDTAVLWSLRIFYQQKQGRPCPNLWNLEPVPSHGKRCWGCDEVRYLEMQRLFWIMWVAPIKSHGPLKSETLSCCGERDMWWWDKIRAMQCGRFEDEGRGQWAKNCGSVQKLEKVKNWIIPCSLQEGAKPCRHLDFSPMGLVSDFWPSER